MARSHGRCTETVSYEVNNQYVDRLESSGMSVVGRSHSDDLVEMIEIPGHGWFVACQFHPEFNSSPRDCHPLFRGFIEAANQHTEHANDEVSVEAAAS